MTHPAPTSAFLTAVLLAASGCGLSLSTEERVQNVCTADTDCVGAVCDVSLGMCVSPTVETLRVGFEVTPPGASGEVAAATQNLGPFAVDAPLDVDLALIPPIKVIGTVRIPGRDQPIGANVRFTRPGAFPGSRAIRVETTTLATPFTAEDGAPADYELEVLADLEYQVTIEPVGEWVGQYPPITQTHYVSGGGDIVRLPLEYPEEMTELRGIVTGSTEEPADGLSVWAVDADGRRVSSTSVTGAGDDFYPGEFRVVMPPGLEDYRIRVSAGEDATSPTIFADQAYLILDERGFVNILVPMIQPVCYRGSAELGQTGERIEGATLTFTTTENVVDEDTGLRGTFQRTITTGPDGVFEAQLLPGTYDVLVAPPEDHEVSGYGVLLESGFRIEATERDCIQGQLFLLPERSRLGGQVKTPDNRTMSGATVRATALRRVLEGAPAAGYNRSGDATTDATGQFDLPLDLGLYDLVVKPPEDSNFPWKVVPAITIDAADAPYRNYDFSSPIPVSGVITDIAGPVAGAEVRAFAVIADADGTERTITVARTVSEEDGSYRILLPADL